MSGKIETVSIIGGGNVAWHFGRLFNLRGYDCKQLPSREKSFISCFDSDLVVLAVKDEVIASLAKKLKGMHGILVHTSGFVATDCLSVASGKYGSLYPLQSLKKDSPTDYDNLPLCTFANTEKGREILQTLAKTLTNVVYELSDEQRKTLHLAATFCNNFPNHLFGIAREIMRRGGVPFEMLFPLMELTVKRAKEKNPFDVQTGPAFRQEYEIMRQHQERLSEDEAEIYRLMSNKIMKHHYGNK